MYLSKISESTQGCGIKILVKPTDLLNSHNRKQLEQVIVQSYVKAPLLIDGLKHDLRLYMLIVSVDPFIVYLNEEGLARFCTAKYSEPTGKGKIEENAQLTNYTLNKDSENFVLTQEINQINNGSKRTLSSYWKSVTAMNKDTRTVLIY